MQASQSASLFIFTLFAEKTFKENYLMRPLAAYFTRELFGESKNEDHFLGASPADQKTKIVSLTLDHSTSRKKSRNFSGLSNNNLRAPNADQLPESSWQVHPQIKNC